MHRRFTVAANIGTGAEHLAVIDLNRRAPCGIRMAKLAFIDTEDVTGGFTDGMHTIVTITTSQIRNQTMIKYGHRPGRSQMTGFAAKSYRDVVLTLASGNDAVMTGYAIPFYLIMIHSLRWHPSNRGMAGIADGIRRNMINTLAGGSDPIVTIPAGGCTDSRMIKQATGENLESAGHMAGVTLCVCSEVLFWLSHSQEIVMTSRAFVTG